MNKDTAVAQDYPRNRQIELDIYYVQPGFSYYFLSNTKTFISDGDLGTADYVAIAVSLGMTVIILAAIAFLLWRARNRSEMGTNNNMSGRVSIKFFKATFNIEAKNSKRILVKVIVL